MGYVASFNEIEQWWDELRHNLSGEALVRTMEQRIAGETDHTRRTILNRFLADYFVDLGKRDAAEAIRRRDSIVDIYRWRDAWRETDAEPDIISVLQERMRHEAHPDRLQTFRYLLADEYRERGDFAAAEAVLLACLEADPESPRPLISLANQKLYREEQPEAAMRFIDHAIEVAMGSGLFRREALGVKARVALEQNAYPVVEDILRQILALTFTRGHLDIGAERDFFDRLPPGIIDAEVARAYDAYCRERGCRRTASAEQLDQFILAAAKPAWLKVARIVAEVVQRCQLDQLRTDHFAVAARIRRLVDQGELSSQGDLLKWRYSEVRLSEAGSDAEPATAAAPSSEGTSAPNEGVAVIATRTLTMTVDDCEIAVPVRIYAPVDKQDHWRCEYEVGWPAAARRGWAAGTDAVQSLLLAMQKLAVDIYTSEAHESGQLKWERPGGGYGLPIVPGLGDLYEGDDRLMSRD